MARSSGWVPFIHQSAPRVVSGGSTSISLTLSLIQLTPWISLPVIARVNRTAGLERPHGGAAAGYGGTLLQATAFGYIERDADEADWLALRIEEGAAPGGYPARHAVFGAEGAELGGPMTVAARL